MYYPYFIFFLSLLLGINPNFACNYVSVEGFEIKCINNDWLAEEDAQQQCSIDGTVCAFFKGDECDRGGCQRYTHLQPDECSPCDDSAVRSFKDIPCTGEKVFCDPKHRPTYCNLHFDPVCGFNPDCDSRECSQTFKTPCNACADSTTEYYTRGRCLDRPDEKRTFCDPNYKSECDDDNTDDKPVCAHKRECFDLNLNPSCAKTIRNGCTACNDPFIEFYTPGECQDEKIFCDPDNRPNEDEVLIDDCDLTVCVYFSDCEGSNCREEYFHAMACVNTRAEYYILGKCQ